MFTMAAFFFTDFMNIHIRFLFLQHMCVNILQHQAGKYSDHRFAGQDFHNCNYRNCIGDHDRKHFI